MKKFFEISSRILSIAIPVIFAGLLVYLLMTSTNLGVGMIIFIVSSIIVFIAGAFFSLVFIEARVAMIVLLGIIDVFVMFLMPDHSILMMIPEFLLLFFVYTAFSILETKNS